MTLYQFKMLTEDDQCGARVVIVYAEYLFLSPKDGIDLFHVNIPALSADVVRAVTNSL